MSTKTIVLMRAKEVHTTNALDFLGNASPVELHPNAFCSDGIEYEIGKDGTFEVREAHVHLLESHGFERVPPKAGEAAPAPRYVLGPNGKFMSRADADKLRAKAEDAQMVAQAQRGG